MNRAAAAVVVLAVATVTSGCVGVVTGDPIRFEASPAAVDDAALQKHGFETVNESSFTVRREADLPVVGTREVVIVNHVATYAGGAAGGGGESQGGAGLVVLSTPQAQVLGQGVNPLGRVPIRELVERVGSRAGEQTDVEKVGETTATVLGTETTVEKYASTTSREGETVRTYVYVTRVAHEDDYVIAVGVLPQKFEDMESTLYDVMAAIEHPVETT